MGDDRTEQFRAVFDAEDIFDRFVRNANAASGETSLPVRDDEPTGRIKHPAKALEAAKPVPRPKSRPAEPTPIDPSKRPTRAPRKGGAPNWDHEITVKAESPYDADEEEGTRPDAPMPLAMARAFGPEGDEDSGEMEVDEDILTAPRASPLTTDSGQRILLLTRVKKPSLGAAVPAPTPVGVPYDAVDSEVTTGPMPSDSEPFPLSRDTAVGARPDEPVSDETTDADAAFFDAQPSSSERPSLGTTSAVAPQLASERKEQVWESSVTTPGSTTQRLEAERVVPDVVAAGQREDTQVGEGGEDGQMPTRQLDQILGDMAVLLRYGHDGQVQGRLEELRRVYPEDLLLMRRLAEFYVEHDRPALALEPLFALAGALFERRNLEGMRQVLEQVLKLDPDNARAFRLLGLLEHKSG